ncbi:MAG: molybdopterin-synthase adenylyltransferase MoeB [Betaproteobacteria bacterium]
MNDRDLLRYSRHILLNEFGIEAQQRLADARALVIGAGGLGSAALYYLATAGVAHISIADGDTVDLTNLQRQIIHREDTIGMNKAESAARSMKAINSAIATEVIAERLAEEALRKHVALADVVLDCSDNFSTRHAINRACVQYCKPLVSGAAIRFDGQITSFDPRTDSSPCYHCLFPEHSDAEQERCAVMGVFAPLVGIIGAMQAAEAIRMLTDVGESLTGRLLMLEARTMTWQTVKFKRDMACEVCSRTHAASTEEYDYATT